MGSCVAYVIFFVKFLDLAFETGDKASYNWLYAGVIFCLICPIALVKNLGVFAKTSLLGNVLVFICLVSMFYYNFSKIITEDVSENVKDNLYDFS